MNPIVLAILYVLSVVILSIQAGLHAGMSQLDLAHLILGATAAGISALFAYLDQSAAGPSAGKALPGVPALPSVLSGLGISLNAPPIPPTLTPPVGTQQDFANSATIDTSTKPSAPASTLPIAIAFLIASFALFGSMGCATNTGNAAQDRAGRVTNATLSILGRDVGKIALNALANEATTGFSSDWASSLEAGAYSAMGSVVTSSDLQQLLDAWNPAAPTVNEAIMQSVVSTTAGTVTPDVVATVAKAVEAARVSHITP